MPAFVRFMLIYALVLSIGDPITAIVQAAGKVKLYHGFVDTFTLLTLPLSYVAFKYGMSPYYGFVISITVFVLAHGMRLYILRLIFPFSVKLYFSNFVLPSFLALFSTILIILGLTLLHPHPLIMISLSVIVALVSTWLFEFNRTERNYLIDILKSKFSKKHG